MNRHCTNDQFTVPWQMEFLADVFVFLVICYISCPHNQHHPLGVQAGRVNGNIECVDVTSSSKVRLTLQCPKKKRVNDKFIGNDCCFKCWYVGELDNGSSNIERVKVVRLDQV